MQARNMKHRSTWETSELGWRLTSLLCMKSQGSLPCLQSPPMLYLKQLKPDTFLHDSPHISILLQYYLPSCTLVSQYKYTVRTITQHLETPTSRLPAEAAWLIAKRYQQLLLKLFRNTLAVFNIVLSAAYVVWVDMARHTVQQMALMYE